MSTVELTKDNFQEQVTAPGITLVDWWAQWCGPCRNFSPIFEAASQENPDITFAKIDTEAEPELAAVAQISSIPTLMAFRDGVLVFNQPGALSSDGLAQVLTAVRELDMDELRKEETS